MNTYFKKYLLLSILLCVLAFALPTFAQTVQSIKTKADSEIAQRIEGLNNLIDRINSMNRASTKEKQNLSALVQNLIDNLNKLKAKADYQNVTKAFRIHALIIPQIRIMAGADKIDFIVYSLNILANKLQLRIDLATDNKDNLNKNLADLKEKIASITAAGKEARSLVVKLIPDQGNTEMFNSNKAALKAANNKIKQAHSYIVDARKDAKLIIDELKK